MRAQLSFMRDKFMLTATRSGSGVAAVPARSQAYSVGVINAARSSGAAKAAPRAAAAAHQRTALSALTRITRAAKAFVIVTLRRRLRIVTRQTTAALRCNAAT